MARPLDLVPVTGIGFRPKMRKLTSVSAILCVIGTAITLYSPKSIFGFLQLAGLVGLLVAGGYYGFRLLRWLLRRCLWTVRNKLILAFLFIGLIPLIIMDGIAWIAVSFIFRQLSVVYLEQEFDQATQVLHQQAERVSYRAYQSSNAGPERLSELIRQERTSLIELHPGLGHTQFSLLRRTVGDPTQYTRLEQLPPLPDAVTEVEIPVWAGEGFHGMVIESGNVSFRSLLPVRTGGHDYLIFLDLPLDERLVEHIRDQTDIQLSLFALDDRQPEQIASALEALFDSPSRLWNIRWAHVLRVQDWSDQVNSRVQLHGATIEVPFSTLFERLFMQSQGMGRFLVLALWGLTIAFVVVVFVSAIIGVALARSITRSIHNLYAGTRSIGQGNFDYRIPSRDRDQLDTLATAFNQMSESVVRLMNQVSEKERLEKEIEIAREVQTHLFPQKLPKIKRLQLAGACLAARRVSGDYYDFIPYDENVLHVVIADISGKGISAALLMANLQSSIRSHFANQTAIPNGDQPLAIALGAINHQLYAHTSPEKFATLVLSRVDTRQMKLSYCNAGHNPPLVISDGRIHRLTRGGTVAGLLELPEYEEETVSLHPGDLAVYYTDGVVETENPVDEQFGEERLERLVLENAFRTADEIRSLILEQLSLWADGREQRDDTTLVAMKIDG